MLSKEETENLISLFKSGSLENIELAIIIAESNNDQSDLHLDEFEKLWNYLDLLKNTSRLNIPIAQKVYEILSLEKLEIQIKEEHDPIIPSEICLISRLKELSIYSDIPLYLPTTLSFLRNLTKLELTVIGMDKIPSFVFELEQLKILDLCANSFQEIQRDIWKLRNLETLILNFCIKIRFLPNEIFGLPKLKEVYFYNTDINEIPKSIANSSIEVFTNDLKKMTKLFNVKAFSFRMLKCMWSSPLLIRQSYR